MNYRSFLDTTLQGASKIARKHFGKVTGTSKGNNPNQILTQADLDVGEYIIGQIAKTYPEHNILDEEKGPLDKGSRYTWVIDPIDGTSNFAVGSPHYGSMIGLLEDAQPIAGGVVLPAFDQTYIAQKSKGTYCNGKKIQIDYTKTLQQSLIAYQIDSHPDNPKINKSDFTFLSRLVPNILNLRNSGSPFDWAMVAQGTYGGYLAQTTKIWDNVAPQSIIEEAGGVYTDFEGNSMDYAQPLARVDQRYTFCVAPPRIHKELQKIIHNK